MKLIPTITKYVGLSTQTIVFSTFLLTDNNTTSWIEKEETILELLKCLKIANYLSSENVYILHSRQPYKNWDLFHSTGNWFVKQTYVSSFHHKQVTMRNIPGGDDRHRLVLEYPVHIRLLYE